MKNFYLAVQIKENGKFYAYVVRCSTSHNLVSKLKIPGIVAATILPTKKEARATAEAWNDSFRDNGTYIFDTLPDGSPIPF